MNAKSSPQDVLRQIAQIQRMERGKLSVMGPGSAGPFYRLQSWEQGKNVSKYVPREQVPAVAEALAGYQRFEALSQEYARLVIEKTRAEIAGSSKKTKRHPKFSSPRTPKSAS
jgi:hypothetical protein